MVLRCRWAVGVLWAVLTTCYAILTAVSTNYLKFLLFEVSTITQILHDNHHPSSHYPERQVVFLEDQWIGDTPSSRSPGNFGLWRWCTDRLSCQHHPSQHHHL